VIQHGLVEASQVEFIIHLALDLLSQLVVRHAPSKVG
jgi:hypothetical protein